MTEEKTVQAYVTGGLISREQSHLLNKTISGIVARGNDAEVRTCKEGIKVLEVTKRVAVVIPLNK